MIKRESLSIFVCIVFFIITQSCKKYYENDSDNSDSSGANSVTGYEDPSDYNWKSDDVFNISLNGTSISEDCSGAESEGSILTIKSSGTYKLSGTLTNGQIVVNTSDLDIVRIIFDGVNISCLNSAPFYVKSAVKVMIVLADNSVNSLTDGSSYVLNNEGEPTAAVFSKSYLSFYGTGSLTVKANYQDGIVGKDGLVIRNGVISVTSADDGIRGKDYLIINYGSITVNAKGDGLKSDNENDASYGYIIVDSASLNITASGDGISSVTKSTFNGGTYNIITGGGAGSTATLKSTVIAVATGLGFPGTGGTTSGYSGTVSAKGIKTSGELVINKGVFNISSADDACHSNGSVIINDGTVILSSGDDAIHAESSIDIKAGKVSIIKSYEGIESYSITVEGGEVGIVSSDDGFNASKGNGGESNDGSLLSINGGNIYVNSSTGDGLDSNGSISVSGGTIIVHGPQSNPEVGMDYNGTCNVTGGFIIISGTNSNMTQAPGSASSLYSLKIMSSSSIAASTLFHLQDASGKDIVTFKPVRSYYSVVFSSSQLTNGATYYVYTGGTSTGKNTNGLVTDGVYSGGTLKKSFTISSKVTSISF
jgi:hypothetical protein